MKHLTWSHLGFSLCGGVFAALLQVMFDTNEAGIGFAAVATALLFLPSPSESTDRYAILKLAVAAVILFHLYRFLTGITLG